MNGTPIFPESIVDGSKYYSTVIGDSSDEELTIYLKNVEQAILCELETDTPSLAGWEVWTGRGGSMCVWAMLLSSELSRRGHEAFARTHKHLVSMQYVMASSGASFITPDLFLKNAARKPEIQEHPDELFCWCEGDLAFVPLNEVNSLESMYVHRLCGRPHRVWARTAHSFYQFSNRFVGGPYDGHEMELDEICRLDLKGEIKEYRITDQFEDNLMSGQDLHAWEFFG